MTPPIPKGMGDYEEPEDPPEYDDDPAPEDYAEHGDDPAPDWPPEPEPWHGEEP